METLFVFLFAAPIITAGIALIVYARSSFSRKLQHERGRSITHQQATKTQRQIERRRGRVWWKIDDLYAEFEERSAVRMPVGLLPPSEDATSDDECVTEVRTGEECTLKDVQDAYEVFRRQS